MNDKALLPCPFCGSAKLKFNGSHRPYWYVECVDCGASDGLCHTKDQAHESWNRRYAATKSSPSGVTDEVVGRALRALFGPDSAWVTPAQAADVRAALEAVWPQQQNAQPEPNWRLKNLESCLSTVLDYLAAAHGNDSRYLMAVAEGYAKEARTLLDNFLHDLPQPPHAQAKGE